MTIFETIGLAYTILGTLLFTALLLLCAWRGFREYTSEIRVEGPVLQTPEQIAEAVVEAHRKLRGEFQR